MVHLLFITTLMKILVITSMTSCTAKSMTTLQLQLLALHRLIHSIRIDDELSSKPSTITEQCRNVILFKSIWESRNAFASVIAEIKANNCNSQKLAKHVRDCCDYLQHGISKK